MQGIFLCLGVLFTREDMEIELSNSLNQGMDDCSLMASAVEDEREELVSFGRPKTATPSEMWLPSGSPPGCYQAQKR